MRIQVASEIRLDGVPDWLRQKLVERFTISNPAWQEKKRLGRWLGQTPRQLAFYGRFRESLFLPRGFVRQLLSLCRSHDLPFEFVDQRRALPPEEYSFLGQLRPFQVEAVEAVALRDFGTLTAPTGAGKTLMALWLIAHRRQPALIVVHTRELMEQWLDRVRVFLGIPPEEIGLIGGGKKRVGKRVTVALVQSLYRCARDVSPQIGHLIVDECHRTPARTFSEGVSAFDSKYMLGLSATPWRRDNLTRLIFWYLGDLAHRVDQAGLLESGDVLSAEVVLRETGFRPSCDPVGEYPQMISELTQDRERNVLIAGDVALEAGQTGGVCLILSDRKAHCEAIRSLLDERGVGSELLTGDLPREDRQRVVERVQAGQVRVLVATGQLIGEGFDCRELTTLFLATPIRFDGRLLQYLGRVLRPAPGKDRAQIYDYVDVNVGVLVNAARARQKVYRGNKKSRAALGTEEAAREG